MHRFVWDLRYPGAPGGNPMMRMFGLGAGPWAPPGQYQLKLTANGQSYTQPLTLKMDPRVKTSQADLVKQFEIAQQIGAAQAQVGDALATANGLHGQLQSLASKSSDRKPLADQISALDRKTMALAGRASGASHFEEEEVFASDIKTLRSLNSALANVGRAVGSADVAPTGDAFTAYQRDRVAMQKILAQWGEIKSQDLPKLNESLKQANLQPVVLEEENRLGR
jgi:hypothetical protein